MQHAHMLLRVIVHSPGDLKSGGRPQQHTPVDDPQARTGRDVFFATACINCHTIGETKATVRLVPT